MAEKNDTTNVLSLLDKKSTKVSSTEKIWGKPVVSHGYAGVPSILLRAQHRLGLTSVQLNILIQLLDYWMDPTRPPFPSKTQLAGRIGINPKTVQVNVRALENAGFVSREYRKTASGDFNSNIYHLDGLVKKIQSLEPEFAAERESRKAAQKKLITPKGKIKS